MKSTIQNITVHILQWLFAFYLLVKLRHLSLLILMFFKWPQEQVNYINVCRIAAIVEVFISGWLKASGQGAVN